MFGVDVIHAHDQCGVAVNLCAIGKKSGFRWMRVPRSPEFSNWPESLTYSHGVLAELAARGLSSLTKATLHIHGGHLSSFCLRTKRPYVLHIHGSEIRTYDSLGVPRFRATPDTIEAMRKAFAVVYSTPDLSPFVKSVRPDAIWLPTPLDRSKGLWPKKPGDFADVFFPHSWDDAKGIHKVAELVSQIRQIQRRPIRLIGVALGAHQNFGRQLGFQLMPPVDRRRHLDRMINSTVVLGQGLGVVVANDLEAIAHNANLVLFPLEENAVEHYGLSGRSDYVSTIGTTAEALLHSIQGLSQPDNSSIVSEIRMVHSDQNISRILASVYSDI